MLKSDWDGDIVATTDNPLIYKSIFPSLGITYEKQAAGNKTKITPKKLPKADLDTFNSTIGQVTNYSTSFYALLARFEEGSPEYEAIITRLKLTRKHQGNSIDGLRKSCRASE